jgi:hypothetical protein
MPILLAMGSISAKTLNSQLVKALLVSYDLSNMHVPQIKFEAENHKALRIFSLEVDVRDELDR